MAVNVYRGETAFGSGDTALTVSIGGTVDTSKAFIIVTEKGANTDTERCRYSAVFNSTTQITLTRGESGTASDVTWQVIEATNGEFEIIDSGTVAIGSSDTTKNETVNDVGDTGQCTVFISGDFANSDDNRQQLFTAELTTTTNLQFVRKTSGSTGNLVFWIVKWHSSVNVYNGTINMTTATASASIGGTVNLARTALFLTFNADTNGLAQSSVLGYLDTTTVYATRESSTGNADVKFSVVEFPSGVVVQSNNESGTFNLGTGVLSTTATISAVTTGNSMVVHSNMCTGTGTAYNRDKVSNYLTNSTTITFECDYTGQTRDICYYAIDFSGWNNPPTVALGTPADTATVSDPTPDLTFTGTDPESDDVRYNVQVSDTSTFGTSATYPTNTSQDSSGSFSFGNITGVQQDGGLVMSGATNSFSLTRFNYVDSDTFGFNIPTGATITGVKVEINKHASQNESNRYITDHTVQLIKGGTASGDNKADTSTKWGTASYVTVDYGGETDLWGLTLTPSDINASNFGIRFTAQGGDASGGTTSADIDYIRITVYYNLIDAVSGTDSGFTGTPDNSDPFTSGQAVTYTVQSGDTLADGTYYWRVRGIDPSGTNGYGDWATTRSFTVTSGTIDSDNRGARTKGLATTSDSRSARTYGGGSMSVDYVSITFSDGTVDSNSRNARIKGQVTTSDSRNARIKGLTTTSDARNARVLGQVTASDARNARVLGQATTSDSRNARLKGQETTSDSRSAKTAGLVTTNDTRSGRTIGQATDSDSRGARILGQDTTSDARSARTIGQVTTSDARNAKAKGVDTISDTRNARVLGQITTDDTRNARTKGLETTTSYRNARTIGSVTASDSRNAITKGAESANDSRGAKTKGIDTTSNSRNARIIGSVTVSDTRSAKTVGLSVTSDSRSARILGQVTTSDSRSARTLGLETTSDSRSARTLGQVTADNSRNARTIGQATTTSYRNTRILGQVTASDSRGAKTAGVETASDTRSARTWGLEITSDTRNARVLGQVTASDTRNAKTKGTTGANDTRGARTWGVDTTSDSRGARTWGELATSDSRNAKTKGTTGANDSRNARTYGVDTTSDTRSARVLGQVTTTDTRSARTIGQITTSDSRGAVIVGQITTSDSRNAKTVGQETTTDSRGARTLGQITASDNRGAKTVGQVTTTDTRNARTWGKQSADDSRGAKTIGSITVEDSRGARTVSKDTVSSSRNVRLEARQISQDVRSARTVGSESVGNSRNAKIRGTGWNRENPQNWYEDDPQSYQASAGSDWYEDDPQEFQEVSEQDWYDKY